MRRLIDTVTLPPERVLDGAPLVPDRVEVDAKVGDTIDNVPVWDMEVDADDGVPQPTDFVTATVVVNSKDIEYDDAGVRSQRHPLTVSESRRTGIHAPG